MNPQKLDFSTFILSLTSTVYMSLGLMPNPHTGKSEKNLASAKETISLLEILQEKTKGNLTKEESDLFEHALYECRMEYLKGSEEKK